MPDPLPEVQFAEHPQRTCRRHETPDGYVDHFCALPEMHPGPCCPRTSRAAIIRRAAWEQANPGWADLAKFDDPFQEIKP